MREYYYTVSVQYLPSNEFQYIYYKNFEDAMACYNFWKNCCIKEKIPITFIQEVGYNYCFDTDKFEVNIFRHVDVGKQRTL